VLERIVVVVGCQRHTTNKNKNLTT